MKKKLKRKQLKGEKYIHYIQTEMYEITQFVGKSDLGISRILKELKVNRTTLCNGYNAYLEYGHEGLVRNHSRSNGTWSKINS